MIRAVLHNVTVEVVDGRVTCPDPELREYIELRIEHTSPPGYFVSEEFRIVALFEELGATITERPTPPSSEPGTVY